MTTETETAPGRATTRRPTMRAARPAAGDRQPPDLRPMNAPARITTTTIRGTDAHLLEGGLVAGREPVGAVQAGLGDRHVVATFRPGGKGRMPRLMPTIEGGRIALSGLATHRSGLDRIEKGHGLFAVRRDGAFTVAVTP